MSMCNYLLTAVMIFIASSLRDNAKDMLIEPEPSEIQL